MMNTADSRMVTADMATTCVVIVACSRCSGSRFKPTSSTPSTFVFTGCAWHSAWLQEGSL